MLFLVSNCLLIYVYEFFIDICLYCVLFEIKILFSLLVFSFPHMRLCILFKCFRKYTGFKELLFVNFELFKLCFVTNCQKGSLLGSKDLGFMYLDPNLYCWQTMIKTMYLNYFRIAQSWFFVVKLD